MTKSLSDARATLFGADGLRWAVGGVHELEEGNDVKLIDPPVAAELVAVACDDPNLWPELLDLYRDHIGAIVGPPSALQIDHDIRPTLVEAFASGRLLAWRRPLFDQLKEREKRIFRRAVAPSLPSVPRIGKIIKEKTFLDVTVVDDDEQPVVGKRFKLELPSGATEHGRLDGTGRLFRPNIDPGTARLTFLAEEADAVNADDQTDIGPEKTFLDVTVVDADQQPMAGARYELELPSGEVEKGVLDPSGRLFRPDIESGGTARLTLLTDDGAEIDAGETAATETAAPEAAELATTPSAVLATSIVVVLVDQDGTPVPNAPFSITLADGSTREGTVDEQGIARFDEVPVGACEIRFLSVDDARIQGSA